MNFELRDYQKLAYTGLVDRLNSKKVAVYEAPTGSGKTLTALYTCISFARQKHLKSIVWVAHQSALSIQPIQDLIKSLGGVRIDDNHSKVGDILLTFMTWQSLRNVKTHEFDILVIDEFHQGSSGNVNGSEHKSFVKILQKEFIEYHLYVSATPWDLDPKLFKNKINKSGKFKKEFRVKTTYEELQGAGILCDVELVSVQTADTLKLKRLNYDTSEIVSGVNEELAEKVVKKKVSLKHEKSRSAIRKSMAESLIRVYLDRECPNGVIKPTIIFAKNIDTKGDPLSCESLNELFKKAYSLMFGMRTPKTAILHSGGDLKDSSSKILSDFAMGKYSVLVVVGMAREGFNYPNLTYALDFAPAFENDRLQVQKIGRIIRSYSNKSVARYYYPDSFDYYINQKNVKDDYVDKLRLNVGGRVEEEELDVVSQVQNSLNYGGKLDCLNTGEENPYVTDRKLVQEEIEIEIENDEKLTKLRKPTKKVKSSLTTIDYIIAHAHSEKLNTQTDKLFNRLTGTSFNNSDENKQKLISLAKLGQDLPPLFTQLGNCGYYYNCKSHDCYDEEFVNQILSINPNFYKTRNQKTYEKIISLAKNGVKRPTATKSNSKEEKSLAGSITSFLKNEENFNIIKEIAPTWIKTDTVKLMQINLEDNYYKKSTLPPEKTREKSAHKNYFNKKGDTYQEKWCQLMTEKYPFIKQSRSYLSLLKLMPKNVKLKNGQTYKGSKEKYIFICEEFGEFSSSAGNIKSSWKRGLSGHPKAAILRRGLACSKAIRNSSTGKIYRSLSDAARSMNMVPSGIANALKNGTKCGGFHWEYV